MNMEVLEVLMEENGIRWMRVRALIRTKNSNQARLFQNRARLAHSQLVLEQAQAI
jgi:hypothetical protein